MPTASGTSAVSIRNVAARRICDVLIADSASRFFRVLPDCFIDVDYYACIPRPLALADLRDLAMGPGRYTLADIQRDLRRMISNAKKFNLPQSQIYTDAMALERLIRRAVKDLEKSGDFVDDEDAL